MYSSVNWRLSVACMAFVIIAVLVIVDGQPSPEFNCSKTIGQLVDVIAKLETKVTRLETELSTERPANKCEPARDDTKGAPYIRWGRTTCEGNATVIYSGYATGPLYNVGGSGSNFLCLPEDPQWKKYNNGEQTARGVIAGVEYELFDYGPSHVLSSSNNGGNSLRDNPAPCAVCYAGCRSSVLMIPAKTQCPQGWVAEYSGYLVSERHLASRLRSSYICWDEAPETAAGDVNQDQSIIFPVEVRCGSIPCSVYINGRELTCVVCSK